MTHYNYMVNYNAIIIAIIMRKNAHCSHSAFVIISIRFISLMHDD